MLGRCPGCFLGSKVHGSGEASSAELDDGHCWRTNPRDGARDAPSFARKLNCWAAKQWTSGGQTFRRLGREKAVSTSSEVAKQVSGRSGDRPRYVVLGKGSAAQRGYGTLVCNG